MRTRILEMRSVSGSEPPLVPGAVPILDVRITHVLPWAGQPQAVCRVSIFQRNGQTVVVMTEPPDNRGVSVTNAAEYIAAAVTDLSLLWEKHPDEVTWVEHYPERGEGIRIEETWDEVEFRWDCKEDGWHAADPVWHPLDKEDVLQILAG